MREQTRRQFIKFLSYLTLSGFAAFSPLCAGCRKEPISMPKNHSAFEPAYLRLHRSGKLKKRGEELWNIMESCRLCPRECGVNRLEGNKGFCQSTSQLEVSSYHPHFGEEKPLVGKGGSGTIFLTNCGLIETKSLGKLC